MKKLDVSNDEMNHPILPKPKGKIKEKPIPLSRMFGTKAVTQLLAPERDHLFLVEEQPTLPKP